jgi:hypothetical protein
VHVTYGVTTIIRCSEEAVLARLDRRRALFTKLVGKVLSEVRQKVANSTHLVDVLFVTSMLRCPALRSAGQGFERIFSLPL